MQKKQKSNLSILNKTIFTTSLVAVFATGLFGVNNSGNFLSNDKSNSLLLKHAENLNDEEYDKFILGRSFFTIPWVEAPSATTARDGLGPLFNANSCVSCHPSNGRGTLLSENGTPSRALVTRLSINSNGSSEHENLL